VRLGWCRRYRWGRGVEKVEEISVSSVLGFRRSRREGRRWRSARSGLEVVKVVCRQQCILRCRANSPSPPRMFEDAAGAAAAGAGAEAGAGSSSSKSNRFTSFAFGAGASVAFGTSFCLGSLFGGGFGRRLDEAEGARRGGWSSSKSSAPSYSSYSAGAERSWPADRDGR